MKIKEQKKIVAWNKNIYTYTLALDFLNLYALQPGLRLSKPCQVLST